MLAPHNEAGKAVVALVSHYLTNKLITVCQPKALRHTLAVAALMPLSPCRSSPLITGAHLAFALLYRHVFFRLTLTSACSTFDVDLASHAAAIRVSTKC